MPVRVYSFISCPVFGNFTFQCFYHFNLAIVVFRVVVLLLREEPAKAFLAYAKEVSFPSLTFVAVGLRDVLAMFPDVAAGSLSIRASSSEVPGFGDYLQRLNYGANGRNPWFRSYVEQKSGCRKPAACSNATPALSSSDDAASTVTSVFALASGLDQARRVGCRESGTCHVVAGEALWALVTNFTRDVRITRHDGSVFKFAGGNSGNGRLDVSYYLRGSDSSAEFAKVSYGHSATF